MLAYSIDLIYLILFHFCMSHQSKERKYSITKYTFTKNQILLMKNDFEKEFNKNETEEKFKNMFIDSHFKLDKLTQTNSENVMVIDLGGTYLKLALIKSDYSYEYEEVKYKIERTEKTKNIDLFDWIVTCVKDYMEKAEIDTEENYLNAAISFSYPVEMNSISEGKILAFTKEFPFKDIDLSQKNGIDPLKVLNEKFKDLGIKIYVAILMNDTVATLLTSYQKNKKCEIGIVLGTGTNAAFVNKEEKIINSEWGQFKFRDSELLEIPFLNQCIDDICGGLGLKKDLQGICKNEQTDEIILNYYDGDQRKPFYSIMHKLKTDKYTVLSILTIVILGKKEQYIIGVNGSGLENKKDQDMFRISIIEAYQIIYNDVVDVVFIFEDGASLKGLAVGFYMSCQKLNTNS